VPPREDGGDGKGETDTRLLKLEKRLPKVKPTFLQKSKYRHLLDDPQVNRWFRNLLRGSPVTAGERLRRLGWLCEHFNTSTREMAKLRRREAEDFLYDMVTMLEDQGKRSSYISNLLKAAKSWFKFNRKHVEVDIKLTRETGLYDREKAPTTPELRRILDAADTRQKAGISLMAFSGFRDETLGDYTGVDGLKMGDFPEMEIKDGKVNFKAIPTLVICRAPISKIGYEYASFLNVEGCEYLQAYLEERMRPRKKETKRDGKTVEVEVPGETLNPETPIITPKQLNIGSHIRTSNISDMLKKAIEKAGFNWRPYAFRRYCSTKLLHAEEDGLPHSYGVFWTGHNGEILLQYTLHKGLDDVTLNKLRAAYAKADEAHLTTRGRKEVPPETLVSTMRRTMLGILGYSEEELRKMDVSQFSEEQFRDLLRQKAANLFGLSGKSRQKIIPMDQVSQAVGEGWEFVTQLPNEQAVVRLPS
jgi:hypothetical protein